MDPLRQGEFGGVNGGFYQGGGGGGGGGGGATEEEDEEEEGPATQGPGAFGVLSGLFGIFSGLGTLSPSRIIQSTVNFFPPGQRQMAQMIVDSLIGYTPPENRTHRPRPRTRRPPTTPMTITAAMMKEVTTTASTNGTVISAKANETSAVVSKDAEAVAQAEISVPATTEGFINLHELLERSTTPEPLQTDDDENDFETKQYTTNRPGSNSSNVYKVKAREPAESGMAPLEIIETRGVDEGVRKNGTNLNETSTKISPFTETTTALNETSTETFTDSDVVTFYETATVTEMSLDQISTLETLLNETLTSTEALKETVISSPEPPTFSTNVSSLPPVY